MLAYQTRIIGGKIPPKEHTKLRIEDALDRVLERMVFAKMAATPFNVRKDCLYRPQDLGPMWFKHMDPDSEVNFFDPSAVNSPKLVWPMEIGAVFAGRNSEWGDHVHCVYSRSVPAKSLRGNHKFVGGYNVLVYDAFVTQEGEWLPACNAASWVGGKWLSSGRMRHSDAFMDNVRPFGGAPVAFADKVIPGEMSIGERAAMAQSMALSYRYEWGAQFSVAGSSKIIIPVTPAGVLELFNDRNKPEDKDRRAALRHWVSQHLRKKQGGNFSDVRAHLRGEVDFQWRGFDVKIRPSAFDAERAA